MQPDRFTVKSQEAVAAAQQLAAQRRNPEVAPAHLLLALVQQDDGLVAPILQKTGAHPASVGTGANEAIEALPKLSGDEQPDVRPSSAFLAVLQGAEREMGKLGDEYISTDHILLAMTEKDSGVAELLPEAVYRIEQLAQHLREPIALVGEGATRLAPELAREAARQADHGAL